MSAPIVEARSLRKTYDTGAVHVDALRGVDLVLEQGEMVAIMGPSGCGKTTLLNCLSGLDSIDGGEALIEGTPLVRDVGSRADRLPRAANGLRLPVLQPDSGPHRGRERRAPAARVASRSWRGARARARRARPRRTRRPCPARTRRALGRRAPARHDRPLAGQRPGHRLGRRADGRPRLGERRRDRRSSCAGSISNAD